MYFPFSRYSTVQVTRTALFKILDKTKTGLSVRSNCVNWYILRGSPPFVSWSPCRQSRCFSLVFLPSRPLTWYLLLDFQWMHWNVKKKILYKIKARYLERSIILNTQHCICNLSFAVNVKFVTFLTWISFYLTTFKRTLVEQMVPKLIILKHFLVTLT